MNWNLLWEVPGIFILWLMGLFILGAICESLGFIETEPGRKKWERKCEEDEK